ncbi:MAG: hypothetical protein HC886_13505 [Leptolyngbyaceae cyanobacterium SM1_1_3]|nr:hypothetical protein [Leptolyngbyaceae cyanobacterium SM1_1_3]NJN04743.1 hypothetical protein [Leptolyngbyaceae cyanobacterium RM1_1_2]NJO10910.1 hypothetical protein [Leptolyngbyaceae cyanobacterium SL_1_1]
MLSLENPEKQFSLATWLKAVFKVVGFRLLFGTVVTLMLLFTGNQTDELDNIGAGSQPLQMSISRPQPAAVQISYLQRSHSKEASLPVRGPARAFDPAVANRLKHQGFTPVVLTGHHLTRAHLFTDLPD